MESGGNLSFLFLCEEKKYGGTARLNIKQPRTHEHSAAIKLVCQLMLT